MMKPKKIDDTSQQKKLLIAILYGQGFKSSKIAKYLGIDPGNFSRDFPVQKLGKRGG